jgi:hypothetical protein
VRKVQNLVGVNIVSWKESGTFILEEQLQISMRRSHASPVRQRVSCHGSFRWPDRALTATRPLKAMYIYLQVYSKKISCL